MEGGREQGEERLARLIMILSKEQNYAAISQATTDVNVRKELYEKYGIK